MISQLGIGSPHRSVIRLWSASIAIVLFFLFVAVPVSAQSFSSGSTGNDGAFNPPTQMPPGTQVQGDCSTGPCTVTVSLREAPNHIYHFTTINISTNVTVRFVRNASNTPVILLAQGNVTINGSINISGASSISRVGGDGGPGGSKGGLGGLSIAGFRLGSTGDGPGGGSRGAGAGYATEGQAPGDGTNIGGGGPAYGVGTLVPLLGGSGGGAGDGGTDNVNRQGGGGGGGGGAILIASSTTITFSGGVINASGGRGGDGINGATAGGGGSGGGIRLVANAISGTGSLIVAGGPRGISGCSPIACGGGGAGAPGFIRIEAHNHGSFTPNINPSNLPVTTFGLPPPPPFMPQSPLSLRIVSVAGMNAPANPAGSLQGPPDITVPSSQANPVTVALQAANIPLMQNGVNTVVDVTVTPETGARTTFQSTPLQGTDASSTATASVDLPNVQCVITASVTINLNPTRPTGASMPPMFIKGERVDRIEISAAFGGASQLTYITESGRRVSASQ